MVLYMIACVADGNLPAVGSVGSISAALCAPPRGRGRSAGSFSVQRLVIEPIGSDGLRRWLSV